MNGLIEKDINVDCLSAGATLMPCQCIGPTNDLCCINILRWAKDPENAADLRALIAHKAALKSAAWLVANGAKAVEV